MIKEMNTANYHVQDGSAEVIKIKELVKDIKFEVEFQLRRGYRAIIIIWNEDPG